MSWSAVQGVRGVTPPVGVRDGVRVDSREKAVQSGFDLLLDSMGGAPELDQARRSEAASLDTDLDLTFSKHASARLRSRGIELSVGDLEQIADAMDRLADKKAQESLLLMGDHAFIVGVPKRTVITAMSRQEAVGSVFTNIDSTLVLR